VEYAFFVVNISVLRQANRICSEVSDFHSKCTWFASGRRCVRLPCVHRCKRFASGRRCVRLLCAYIPLPRRNGRSPGRYAWLRRRSLFSSRIFDVRRVGDGRARWRLARTVQSMYRRRDGVPEGCLTRLGAPKNAALLRVPRRISLGFAHSAAAVGGRRRIVGDAAST